MSLLLLAGVALLPLGCGSNRSGGAVVIPQSKTQDTAARIQSIQNDPHLSPEQKQQQVQSLRAEAGP